VTLLAFGKSSRHALRLRRLAEDEQSREQQADSGAPNRQYPDSHGKTGGPSVHTHPSFVKKLHPQGVGHKPVGKACYNLARFAPARDVIAWQVLKCELGSVC